MRRIQSSLPHAWLSLSIHTDSANACIKPLPPHSFWTSSPHTLCWQSRCARPSSLHAHALTLRIRSAGYPALPRVSLRILPAGGPVHALPLCMRSVGSPALPATGFLPAHSLVAGPVSTRLHFTSVLQVTLPYPRFPLRILPSGGPMHALPLRIRSASCPAACFLSTYPLLVGPARTRLHFASVLQAAPPQASFPHAPC